MLQHQLQSEYIHYLQSIKSTKHDENIKNVKKCGPNTFFITTSIMTIVILIYGACLIAYRKENSQIRSISICNVSYEICDLNSDSDANLTIVSCTLRITLNDTKCSKLPEFVVNIANYVLQNETNAHCFDSCTNNPWYIGNVTNVIGSECSYKIASQDDVSAEINIPVVMVIALGLAISLITCIFAIRSEFKKKSNNDEVEMDLQV